MQNKSFLKNLARGVSKRTSKMLYNSYRKLNINPVQLKVLKHLPAGKLRQHKMLGGVVHFVHPQELLHGLKEIFIDEIYHLQLPADAYIIDCGANIGLSIIYLKNLYPEATIVAFEPDEKNFELLTLNVSSYNYKNVDLKKEAVWIENSLISFASEGSMSSKIEQANANTNKVKATRLKDYLNRPVDFLKVDIEGAEYAVMKDIQDSLSLVQNLFLEYHGNFDQNKELIEILNIIEKAGFSFYIKEAASVYSKPFTDTLSNEKKDYDVQLNIFCFRKK